MQEDFKKKIQAYLKYKGITEYRLCKDAGLSRSFMQNFRQPTTSTLRKIHQAFPDLNMHWLITGEGEMLLKPEEESDE